MSSIRLIYFDAIDRHVRAHAQVAAIKRAQRRANKAPRISPHRAGAAAIEDPWQSEESRRTQLEEYGGQEQSSEAVYGVN